MLLDLYQLRLEKDEHKVLTLEEFIDVGATYVDRKELEIQVVHHMIEGNPIDFNNVKLINEFEVKINDNIPKINLSEDADLTTLYQW